MHVVAPSRYAPRPQPKRRRSWPWFIALLIVALPTANYLRPLPAPTTSISLPSLAAASQPAIDWPAYGQSAIGAAGYDVLASNGTQTPLATASIAKVVAALCVLDKLPLEAGEPGKTFTISSADVAIYNDYASKGGSVVYVTEGEQLTEYQALEAVLIPSGNNVADSLVRWVFGSHEAYRQYASTYLAAQGLTNTRIGSDASGFDASTVSTASDLTLLGQRAQASPVIMAIAGKRSTVLPAAGTVTNYNTALGTNDIDGIKTGNNEENPGALLFSASLRIGGSTVPVDGTVMGAPDLAAAIASSSKLVDSLRSGFVLETISEKGRKLGTIDTAWGQSAPVTTESAIALLHWRGTRLYATQDVKASLQSGIVGKLKVNGGKASASANLVLSRDIPGPSFWWRLTRH